MSEQTSVATEPIQTQDASTTQDGQAQVDSPASGEQEQQQQTETPAAEKPPEVESLIEAPEAGPPDEYQWTVPEGLPEGYELHGDVTTGLGEVARELGLTQRGAQSVVDKMVPVMERVAQENLVAQADAWQKEAREDNTFGGQAFQNNLAQAQRGLKAYGSEKLQAILANHPLGSNVELLKLLHKVGETVSEDKFVAGDVARDSVDPGDRDATMQEWYGS